ncbi:MAG TPA: serine protease [Longimicrobium sp.]|nr:serine protease [Longimicrobium sp.]
MTSTEAAPLQNVCHLTTRRQQWKGLWIHAWNPKFSGSAALIEGRYLITAAHNVADYPLANRLMRLEVRCNAPIAANQKPDVVLHRHQLKAQVAVPRYAYRVRIPPSTRKFQFDYAFVDLGTVLPIPNQFALSPEVHPDSGTVIFLAGYPGGDISNTDTLFRAEGAVMDQRPPNLFSYTIATATGNSGGPVWLVRDDEIYLVGVHVADQVARRVDERFYNDWQAWRRKREAASLTGR